MRALALCLILAAMPDDGDHRLSVATWTSSEAKVEQRPDSPVKVTFSGGKWPAIRTSSIPGDWTPWKTVAADITVARPCLIGLHAVQEKSLPDQGWDGLVSRWSRTFFLKAGVNAIRASLEDPSGNGYGLNPQKYGKVTSFEIFFYSPHAGETMEVSSIRLLREKTPPSASATRFKVAGSELVTANVRELGKQLKEKWTKPEPTTVDKVEAEFRAQYERIRKDHPKAKLATFRDGENGYSGWRDAHIDSHGPDTNTGARSGNSGARETNEVFMRHRSMILRADLSAIPSGAAIHAARFILVASDDQFEKGRDPRVDANLWVAEPCNRPWVESEVNAYEYAKDKFWKAVGGMSYGDDPDFHPVYIAHGPGNAPVSTWDFTEAVRFWTDGRRENHGFMLHGDSYHYMGRAHYRESKDVRSRPALLVVYEPR
jgi:hypothetical protein